MAPSALESESIEGLKQLQIEEEYALMKSAESTLLNYGSAFFPGIISRAEGVFIYTMDGQRILDWTSGQMSCLIGHGMNLSTLCT
jgi:4-aminobutyrate aminotransferase-like enzyme